MDGQMAGHTASLWRTGYTSFILGKILNDGAMEILFFLPSAEETVRRTIREKKLFEQCKSLVEDSCYVALEREVLGKLGIDPFQKSIFRYHHELNDWRIDGTNSPAEYSSFTLEKNYSLGNVEEAALGHPTAPRKRIHPVAKLPVQYVHLPIDDLFQHDIVHLYAGLPSQQVNFATQQCTQINERIEDVLSKAGSWDVKLSPEYEQTFQVRLKSHSSREFFYRDGYWWKVFLEIRFLKENGQGKCSQATVYLYDSVVCAGPINDDPDVSGRTQCFQRIEPESKAEIDLQSRLSHVLQLSFGTPKLH